MTRRNIRPHLRRSATAPIGTYASLKGCKGRRRAVRSLDRDVARPEVAAAAARGTGGERRQVHADLPVCSFDYGAVMRSARRAYVGVLRRVVFQSLHNTRALASELIGDGVLFRNDSREGVNAAAQGNP